MKNNNVLIYDTTLRDGTQGEGISFSVADKLLITEKLDDFGIDFVEGGFPGSNPRDIAYFNEVRNLKLRHARVAAFGSTRRAGVKPERDVQLKTLLDSGTPVVTIVGKSWMLHVTEVIRTTAEENIAMIEDSVRYLVAQGREVIFDAEHFFDGHRSDPEFAMRCLAAAARGGAANLTLCDTNGGTLVEDLKRVVGMVVSEFGSEKVGVHCHNDSGLGVAVSLAGIEAGASLLQGTMNGYGERTGNANLTTILPNLFLKMKRTAACSGNLAELRELSLYFDELANMKPDPKAPFVGASAFAHKGGLHADAAQKAKNSYEHIEPSDVGNASRVIVSDMAGRASFVMKAREFGFEIDPKSPQIKTMIEEIKRMEFEGFEFEAADGTLQLHLARWLNEYMPEFEFEGYRVIVGKRGPDIPVIAEATVKVRIGGELVHTVEECIGPVSALDKALRQALEESHPEIAEMELRDFKVRILDSNQGSNSRTRVLIESGDKDAIWGTVGVSDNVIEASWQALRDAIEYKVFKDRRRNEKKSE